MTQAPPPASAMDAESRAVSALVDPAELVDLAGALIRIPSFKTEETPVARFLDGFFRARGYEVDLQEIEPAASRPSPRSGARVAARASC